MAKNSKLGRNTAKCRAYKDSGRRAANKARKAENRAKKLAKRNAKKSSVG